MDLEQDQLLTLFRNLDTGALLDLALILVAAVALVALVQTLLPWLAERLHRRRRHWVLALVPLLRLLVIVGAFLLSVPLLIEPSWQNMVAVLGTVGLAIGFALKDYASSLVAGVVAVGEAPYRNGDWVEIDGIYGEVTHVGMRTLRLVTPDDNLVAIPHSKLWTEAISNANNGGPKLQCAADFFIAHGHDAVAVRDRLQDVALTSPYLDLDSPIVVVAQDFPWGSRYRIRAYPLEPRQQFRFITDLTIRGKTELVRLGVPFAGAPSVPGDA
jgi:small-conductance mechanosensitive channel